jgi:UDP-glucose 6-dehydrogenase
MENITLIGIGRLGICLGLCLEKAKYNVLGIDINQQLINQINNKTFTSYEPNVNKYLQESTNFRATSSLKDGLNHSNIIMILVDTPLGGGDNYYDHSKVSNVLSKINEYKVKNKHIIICATVIPGYINRIGQSLLSNCENTTLNYNPEFIAQGDIINGILNPDIVLIGAQTMIAANKVKNIYINIFNYSNKLFNQNENKSIKDKVTEDKLTEDKLTEDKLTEDKLTEDKLVDNEVKEDKLVDNEVKEDKLVDNEVKEDKLVDNEVKEDEIKTSKSVAGKSIVGKISSTTSKVGNKIPLKSKRKVKVSSHTLALERETEKVIALTKELEALKMQEVDKSNNYNVDINPIFVIVPPLEAELIKISINGYITTKISYANMISDACDIFGINKFNVLNAIGSDSRIGRKYFQPGYSYGGPCFPRDTFALAKVMSDIRINPCLINATTEYNETHSLFQAAQLNDQSPTEPIVISNICYKPNSNVPIIDESAKLNIAKQLKYRGRKVIIRDTKHMIELVKMKYGNMFEYQII